MKDYEESSINLMTDITQNARDYVVVANPIITHRIICRCAVELPEILGSIEIEKDSGCSMAAG